MARRARRTRWLGRLTLALPAVGAAAGAWLLSRGARSRAAGFGALGAAFGLGVVRWQLQRFVTEKVPYEVLATLGDIEIRSYPRQVWAETLVEQETWSGALDEGFRRLAAYIFGKNEQGERLSMTAPVLSSFAEESAAAQHVDRASMKAPVLTSLTADEGDAADIAASPSCCPPTATGALCPHLGTRACACAWFPNA